MFCEEKVDNLMLASVSLHQKISWISKQICSLKHSINCLFGISSRMHSVKIINYHFLFIKEISNNLPVTSHMCQCFIGLIITGSIWIVNIFKDVSVIQVPCVNFKTNFWKRVKERMFCDMILCLYQRIGEFFINIPKASRCAKKALETPPSLQE